MLNLRLRRLWAVQRRLRRRAFQGLVVGVLVMVFVMAAWVMQHRAGEVSGWVLTVGVTTIAVLVAAYLSIPWSRAKSWALLVFPVVWLSGVLVMSLRAGPWASNLVGLTVLAFLFGGVTQRRWHTLWLLVPAVPAWFVMVGASSPATSWWVRFPITLVSWVAASELVARKTHSMSSEVRRLSRAADIDELTGLANRRVLAITLATASPGDALILIDIDHFKQINDEHGHSTGDIVLADFSRMVRRCVRLEDEAIRYGGEEILVVMRQPGVEGITRFDRHLRTEIRSIRPAVTYSAGAAVVGDGELAVQALERADALLYSVKQSDRNRTAQAPTELAGETSV